MEVLNQNQRRSAIWRLLALGIFILAMIAVSLFSTHKAYASMGKDDFYALQMEYDNARKDWEGISQGFKNKIKKLELDLKKCIEDNPDKELSICEQRIEAKQDRIDELMDDLKLCESKLQAF